MVLIQPGITHHANGVLARRVIRFVAVFGFDKTATTRAKLKNEIGTKKKRNMNAKDEYPFESFAFCDFVRTVTATVPTISAPARAKCCWVWERS